MLKSLLNSSDPDKKIVRPFSMTASGYLFFIIPLINLGQLFIPSEYRFVVFTLIPFLNTFSLTFEHTAHIGRGLDYIHLFTYIDAVLIIAPFIVGLGLLSVTQVGWRIFMSYSGALVIYNLVMFIIHPNSYDFITLINSAVLTFIVINLVQKDISIPYMDLHKSRWRFGQRLPLVNDALVNGKNCITRDISHSGVFVYLQNSGFQLHEEVSVHFQLKDRAFDLKGTVVRLDKDGVGIAFKNLDTEVTKELKKLIRDLTLNFSSPVEISESVPAAKDSTAGSEKVRKKLFSLDDYIKMEKSGIVKPDERTELLEGELYSSSSLEPKHASSIDTLVSFLSEALKKRAVLRVQNPVFLDKKSALSPDLSIVRNKDYKEVHPFADDVIFLIEISYGSFDYDKNTKLPVYAKAEIPEVWILNLNEKFIDVCTKPVNSVYQSVVRFSTGTVSPKEFSDIRLKLNQIV